jgi:hypothetical protein
MTDNSRPTQMKQLHSMCRTNLKIWKEFPSGSHNDTVVEPGYFEYIADFINQKVMKRH